MIEKQKKRGRPPKGAKPLTQAEHKKVQRQRLKDTGGGNMSFQLHPQLWRMLEEYAAESRLKSKSNSISEAAKVLLSSALLANHSINAEVMNMIARGESEDRINHHIDIYTRLTIDPVKTLKEVLANEADRLISERLTEICKNIDVNECLENGHDLGDEIDQAPSAAEAKAE